MRWRNVNQVSLPRECHAKLEFIIKQIKSQLSPLLTIILYFIFRQLCHIMIVKDNRLWSKLTARPQMAGRPARQKSAPSANALNISVPRRIPPSMAIGILPFTAGAISRSASKVEGTPSSWRPPWLEMMMPSNPCSAASLASSAV